MQSTEKATFLSIEFTLETNIPQFLAEVLSPAIDDFKKRNLITNVFFVREWEKEHLVKIRLNPADSMLSPDYLVNEIADKINFENYMSSNSCSVNVGELSEREYRAQYVGTAAFDKLVELFEISSISTLMIFVSTYKKWDYPLAMSHAIQKQLIFLRNSFMNLDETISFLKFQVDNCIKLSFNDSGQISSQKSRMLDYFDQSYSKQRLLIHKLAKWLYFDNVSNQEKWMEEWGNGVQNKLNEILRLYSENLVDIYSGHKYESSESIPQTILSKWLLFSDLMHLENNRLGIHYRDEPFIYYLILQAMIDCQTHDI